MGDRELYARILGIKAPWRVDGPGGRCSPGGVRGAQGEARAGSVGGRAVAVHGDIRGVDPGLAETCKHCGGGGDDGAELR